MTADEKLAELGITLGQVSRPAGNYANAVRTGNLLYLSGKAAPAQDGKPPRGRLGLELSTAEGRAFARAAAVELLSVLRDELGTLDAVARIVELQGFVNATADFEEHPQVLDGASDLFVAVFGSRGVHARSVVGASSLRSGVPVVLRAVVEVAA